MFLIPMFNLNYIPMKMRRGFIFLSFLAFMLASIVCQAQPPTQSLNFPIEQSAFTVDSSATQGVEMEAVVNRLAFYCMDPVDYGINS